MKKLLILCIVFCTFSSVYAQKYKMTYGLAAGINIAGMTDKTSAGSYTPDSRIGFKAYFFADAPLSNNFSIQTELGYDGMGFKYKDPGYNQVFTAQVNYITLSVLPKVKVNGTGLSFIAGPTLGFLVSASASDEHGNSGSTTDVYNSVDLYLAGGVQYFFPEGLGFTARYMAGLTNTIKNTMDGETVHNHAWSFTVAYRFH